MNDVTQSRQATYETNPAANKQANNELCSHTTHSGQAAAAFQAWPWHEDPFRSRDVAQDFGGEASSDHETESTNVADATSFELGAERSSFCARVSGYT